MKIKYEGFSLSQYTFSSLEEHSLVPKISTCSTFA